MVINDTSVKLCGTVQSSIGFEQLREIEFQVDLQVLSNYKLGAHLIVSHDLLDAHNITIIYKSNRLMPEDLLISAELSCIDVCEVNDTLNHLSNLSILVIMKKIKLIEVIKNVTNLLILTVDDDYYATVKLKDDSTYVHAPRRFLH